MKLVALASALALAACGSSGSGGGTAPPTAPAGSIAAVPPPAGQDWTQTVSRTAEGFVMGNPQAPIKLVEYGSRLCPTCGALARDGYQPLTDRYVKTGKVSFEFREFLVHGAVDVPPALIGTCVGPEPFFALLEQMFANQESFEDALQKAPPATQQRIDAAPVATRFKLMGDAMGLTAFVQARGVPAATAAACLTDTKRIDALTKQTQDKGPGGDGTVSGTPTLLLNGRVADGVITWPALDAALKRAGA
ncbi:DsbA family protein [Sphingomonas bacterium]|uniref:DsbA family protein n=1 Tax=Sphingomonas bacterium TaxID=1895847 RepID=UPI00157706E4|nr:thioredoxin domain-containing protein [Sphingomonas bacterium]